jgi:hypothetical protein
MTLHLSINLVTEDVFRVMKEMQEWEQIKLVICSPLNKRHLQMTEFDFRCISNLPINVLPKIIRINLTYDFGEESIQILETLIRGGTIDVDHRYLKQLEELAIALDNVDLLQYLAQKTTHFKNGYHISADIFYVHTFQTLNWPTTPIQINSNLIVQLNIELVVYCFKLLKPYILWG